jgi:hypothetical protein
MPNTSIPATAEGLSETKFPSSAIDRIHGEIRGVAFMAKVLADKLDELFDGESIKCGEYDTDLASFAWNDLVARSVRLEADFLKVICAIPTAPESAQLRSDETESAVDRAKNTTLLDGMDELTQARDLFEAAWMAANGLSQREERKAMTALLMAGNNTIVAGLEKIEEFRSA